MIPERPDQHDNGDGRSTTHSDRTLSDYVLDEGTDYDMTSDLFDNPEDHDDEW